MNTPPLLGNSELHSSNAGRFAITLPDLPPGGLGTAIPPSNAVSVVSWETEDNEQQELELLAWYETNAEGSGVPDNGNWPSVIGFSLTKHIGAQGGPGLAVDQPLTIPINGIRMRFLARRAHLRCWSWGLPFGASNQVVLRAAIYPTSGNTEGPEVCLDSSWNVCRIPRGARVFRVAPGVLDAAKAIEFYSLGTLFTGTGDTDTTVTTLSRPVLSISNQLAATWTSIPRGAYWFWARTSFGGAYVNQPQGPSQGAEVFFR